MSPNILITGAAGYIGGSIVSDFLSSKLFNQQDVHGVVRSQEQAETLSKLGINVLRINLTDEQAVIDAVLHHNISIIVHTASAIDPSFALPLITALGKQKEASGEQTYYIHTSGLSAFYERTGWPADQTKDTGPVFEVEKQLADSFPIRQTDVTVIEHAEASGVTSFIVVPSLVYGKGTGPWNQLSVVLPVYVKASIESKTVYKFAENTRVSGVHISDLTGLYARIVEKVLQKEKIPHGTEGYYFALAHDVYFREALDHLALTLKARGIAEDTKTPIWPSDEAAAEALGVPVQYLQPLWNSGDNLVAERPHSIGWKPAWDNAKFLASMDDEVQAVLELGKAKSSLIDSLHQSARG